MNIAKRIEKWSNTTPDKIAVKFPIKNGDSYRYTQLTFKEFNDLSSHYANSLTNEGILAGDKVLLFVKPSLDFPAITFALFKLGAIPILIDPGMGIKNLLKAIKDARPDYLIAVNIVHLIKLFKPDSFKSIKKSFTTQTKLLPGTIPISKFKKEEFKEFNTLERESNDLAAILFTSGGTGRPKGVEYTHGIFNMQTQTLQELFTLTNDDIDLPGFPLFSFFTMSMGMTSVIPDMNPSKPSKCNPEALVKNINDNGVTFVAGSPAIWERVGDYLEKTNQTLKTVKYVVMFGAPVRNEVHEKLIARLEVGDTYTPYGATECLPVSCINGKDILLTKKSESLNGGGTCIGRPCPHVEVKIIKDSDEIITNISDAKELAPNEVGEIIVKSKTATIQYHELEAKTKEAKIYDGESFWHRMGDLGRIDNDGNIWFYGRKVHQVKAQMTTFFPIATEAIFNQHPYVNKSALIWITKNGRKAPAISIEMAKRNFSKKIVKQELMSLAVKHSHTKIISDIYFCKKFPVDIRHNIKIDRKKLSEMAQEGRLS